MKVKFTAIVVLSFVISGVTAQTTKPNSTKSKPDPLTSQAARVPGRLAGDAEAIVVPASITADADFEVTVKTRGGGCWKKGDASVVLGESSADIFVYDMTVATQPGTMCTMILKYFYHKVTLRFTAQDEAVIRVWTRGPGDGPVGKPMVVEKRVTVK